MQNRSRETAILTARNNSDVDRRLVYYILDYIKNNILLSI